MGVPVTRCIIYVVITPINTTPAASRLRVIPPFLNEAKKLGPTCIPIEYMKRMRPNSFMKCRTLGSIFSPRWPKKIPKNRIHVIPSDIPKTLILPNSKPAEITIARTNIACATPEPITNCTNQSII